MDNFFKGCPAKMSDGRLFTDYRMSSRRNEHMKYINNISNEDDYRMFLQQNADKIMNTEWQQLRATKSCSVNECVHTYPTRVYPQWFIEEKHKYENMYKPMRSEHYPCDKQTDYRMS